ncbi:hypothetical protein KJ693_11110 [bacterium]|nr:hypothetical protein [bacterium]
MDDRNRETNSNKEMKEYVLKFTPIGLGIGILIPWFTTIVDVWILTVLILFVAALSFSLWVMSNQLNVLKLKYLTIPGFWYLTYLAMIFVPSFFVFFEHNNPAGLRYLFAIGSVLLTVPMGIFFANLLLKFHKEEIKCYFNKPMQEEQVNLHLIITYLIFLVAAIGLTLMYVRDVETVPLFSMIRNPGECYFLAQLREESFKLLSSPFTYAYYFLRVLIYPFLIMISLGYYLCTRQEKWLFLFLITLFLGVLYASLSIAKLPVAAIFLLIFLFLYLYQGGRVSKKSTVLFLVLIFTFPIMVVLLSYGSKIELLGVLRAIGRRLFYVPAEILYYYFEIFPDQVDYLHGFSIEKVALLFDKQYFNIANYVFKYVFPKAKIESGFANVAFIGNLNADFGMTGVLIGGIITGVIMQTMQIYLLRQEKTILNIAVFSFLFFAFWLLNSISLPIVLLSNCAIFVFILSMMIKTTVSFFKSTVER